MSFQFYFINLERSTERLKNFLKEASFHPNIHFQRFSALVGHANLSGLPIGAHGCSLSHFQILENFLESDSEYAVILEDDIILSCNFSTVLDLPSKLDADWGVVWLGQTLNCHNTGVRPQPKIHEYRDAFLTCSFPLGSFGYLINRKGASEVLVARKTNFTYYDVELINACVRGGFPQLILKEPLVYANVWTESTIEVNSLTDLHERVDLNLYRRDFELNLLIQNSKLLEHFNVEHLFIGRPPSDLDNEVILSHFENFKHDFKKEHLETLKTYKQNLVTDYIAEDIDYFGRGLYFLRAAPITVYIREDRLSDQIPRLPLINYIRGPLKIDREVYVQMTPYHYLTRWQFLDVISDITHVGHRCFDFPVKDYFFQGNKETKKVFGRHDEYLNYYSKFGKINVKFNFLRYLNEYIDKKEELESMIDYLNYKGPTIAFTGSYNPIFAGKLTVTKPSEYPDVLITHQPTRSQGRKNILNLTLPVDQVFSEYDLVINCWKKKRILANDCWLPSFMSTVINLNEIDDIRLERLAGEKTIEVALLREYENIEGFQTVKNDNTKFVIVMERFNAPGYISEDIILAYSTGAVPVYIGCKEVLEFFNPNTFIYLESPDNFVELPAMIDHFDYFNCFRQSIWRKGVPAFSLPW